MRVIGLSLYEITRKYYDAYKDFHKYRMELVNRHQLDLVMNVLFYDTLTENEKVLLDNLADNVISLEDELREYILSS